MTHKIMTLVCLALLGTGLPEASADEWNKKTVCKRQTNPRFSASRGCPFGRCERGDLRHLA